MFSGEPEYLMVLKNWEKGKKTFGDSALL